MTFFFDVFLPYMTKMFSGIIDMMKDSRFTAVFGYNFFWIIVGFWILWQMVNIFLIRPNLSMDSGLSGVLLHRASASSSADRRTYYGARRKAARDALRDEKAAEFKTRTVYKYDCGTRQYVRAYRVTKNDEETYIH